MVTQQKPAKLTAQALRERGAAATTKLREALALPHALTDTTSLGTALAEIAAEEATRNPGFRTAVQSRYAEIMILRNGATKGAAAKPKEPRPELIPIGNMPSSYRIDPFSPPNTDNLVRVFGRAQLARALDDYTVEALKETAGQYEARHPGTKPANRGRRDPLIAYIVEQYDNEQAR